MKPRNEVLRRYLVQRLKQLVKWFFIDLVIFTLAFDANPLGATIWATFWSLFFIGSATYLGWDNWLTDADVLQLLRLEPGANPVGEQV